MIIKSNQQKFLILYFFVLSITPVGFYFKNKSNLYTSITLEIILIIVLIVASVIVKKRSVLFESTDTGINIKGSKEGIYDPDYLKYEEIKECNIDGKRLLLNLTDGRIVILINLGKEIENCQKEILKRINMT